MPYTVYKHTTPSGKVYIGITKQKPEYRWNHGRGYKEKDQKAFTRAILKYGWDNITHEILYINLSEKDAKNIEISLVKQYKALGMSYNMTDGGDGGRGLTGKRGPLPVHVRQKMSEVRKGMLVGEKNPMYGRHETSTTYGKFGKDHPASKKVYQYDIEGNFIREWGSLTEAVIGIGKAQNAVTNITASCRDCKRTAFGFRWRKYYTPKLQDIIVKKYKPKTTTKK